METKIRTAIKEQLESERVTVRNKAELLRKDLVLLDTDLARIDSAIAVLFGDALPPVISPTGKKRKALNPSARTSQVKEFIADELREEELLGLDKLRERVEKRVNESGHSLIGFALRFKEACRDAQFLETPSGFRLRTPPPSQSTTSQKSTGSNGTLASSTNGNGRSEKSLSVQIS